MSGSRSLFAVITLCVLSAVVLSGCAITALNPNRIIGSGRPAVRDYGLDGFHVVSINSAFRATVTRGDAYKVSVTVDDNLLDYVSVTKAGDTLEISYDTGRIDVFSTRTQAEARITMPDLQGVRVNGASQVTVTGFTPETGFDANVNGASKLSGDMRTSNVQLTLNGASQCNLTGSSASLRVDATGASRADLSSLAVDKASVTLNGASQANVNAKTDLEYNLNGASRLTYAGNPAIGNARTEGASRASRQ